VVGHDARRRHARSDRDPHLSDHRSALLSVLHCRRPVAIQTHVHWDAAHLQRTVWGKASARTRFLRWFLPPSFPEQRKAYCGRILHTAIWTVIGLVIFCRASVRDCRRIGARDLAQLSLSILTPSRPRLGATGVVPDDAARDSRMRLEPGIELQWKLDAPPMLWKTA
jgi:hypothetical protein